MTRYSACIAVVAFCVGGCAPSGVAPERTAAAADVPAVERTRLPDVPTPPKAPSEVKGEPSVPAPPAIVVPPNTLYVCVVDKGGVRKQTAIEFAPKVDALCARHPEMGPCQYERNICRSAGGRVYAANGDEITMTTEADYDKKVMRVRFRAN